MRAGVLLGIDGCRTHSARSANFPAAPYAVGEMSSPFDPARDARGTRRAGLLCLALLALLVFVATRSTLWDRDEPRFAQATVEMLESGNWLFPTFDHELRADKPMGIYWLMGACARVFGARDWSMRLTSALATIVAAGACFDVARRLFGTRAALWSLVILGTSPLVIAEGTLATTDATLLACIALSMALFVRAIEHGPTLAATLAQGLALGAAQLVKGPVGLAVPLFSMLAALLALRGEALDRRRLARYVALAALAGIALFLAWGLPANAATGGEFLRRGLGHHVLERTSQPLEGHGGNFFVSLPFYVPVVILGFAPWSALLPLAWTMRGPRWSRATKILLAWSAPCLLLMTLVATKLPHYVLPSFPALAILAARALTCAPRASTRASRGSALAIGVLALVLCGGLALAPRLAHIEALAGGAWSAAVLLGSCWAWAAHAAARGAWSRAALGLVAGQVAFVFALALAGLPAVEATKIAPRLGDAIARDVPADVPIARLGFVEPSLDFRLNRPPLRELQGDAELRAWFDEPGSGLLVVPRDRLERAGFTQLPARASEIERVRGLNVAKGRASEVLAILRH